MWVVTGSAGFALQGLPMRPNDIDLQTDAAGAHAIQAQYADLVSRPVVWSATDRIRSHYGALRITGVTVEIMGDIEKRRPDGSWERPAPLHQHRRFVSVGGLSVPVLDLAYKERAYHALGRRETAALLRRWLDQQPSPPGR